MKFSIITSTYNSASTVEDTLKSVRDQIHTDVEHIIIDGDSKDKTLEIVHAFPHVKKLVSEKDKGIYDAMNKGIALSGGDIIGILNSDDFYADENVLMDIEKVFISTSVECVYADLVYVDQHDVSKVVRKWKSGSFSDHSFMKGWMPPHPTFFVKKEMYEKYGVFNLNMGTAADYELMLRFLQKHKCKVGYLPRVIIKMRTGGASNTSLKARIRANKMDRNAWIENGLKPGMFTFILKPLRKIFQFL